MDANVPSPRGPDTVNCGSDGDAGDEEDFSLSEAYLALNPVEVLEGHDLTESLQHPAS